MPVLSRLVVLPLVLALVGSAGPVLAQSADFTAFRAACADGGTFLLGEAPEGKDVGPLIEALCPCLETGFGDFSQAEVDALEADLRTGSTDEAQAAYPAYEQLQAKATGVLGVCLSSPEVVEAARQQGL